MDTLTWLTPLALWPSIEEVEEFIGTTFDPALKTILFNSLLKVTNRRMTRATLFLGVDIIPVEIQNRIWDESF